MIDMKVNELLAEMRAMAAAARGERPATAARQATASGFADLVRNALRQVNAIQQQAAQQAQAFELGDPKVRLADVMLSLQKANLAFQATVQVRNKLVQAYQEIMNMQV